MITTKKGNKDGQTRVTYSNNFSWGTPTNVPEHTRADLNLQYSIDQQNALKTTPTYEFGYVGFYYNPDVVAKVKNWIDTYGDGSDLGREMVEGRTSNTGMAEELFSIVPGIFMIFTTRTGLLSKIRTFRSAAGTRLHSTTSR